LDGRIVLFGEEPHEPYRRPPLSKDVLRGTTPEEKTRLRPSDSWAQKNIELRVGTSVAAVDVHRRSVSLDDGTALGYHRLLLATGGRARPLPQAAGLRGVHTLRTLANVPALRDALTPGSTVLVIGAGLIGAEVAASARAMDCAVTMLEAAPVPLSPLLPAKIAQVYAALHRGHGVDLHTGVDLEQLEQAGERIAATNADARRWIADAVVVAVGMRPRTELAEQAGPGVGDGIIVDEFFETTAQDVFAAGDVANLPNLTLGGRHRVEHWQSAQDQGAAAAKSMLGAREPFTQVPWCWSDQYGVNLQVCGWPDASDDLTVRGDLSALDFTAVFHREGRLVGAVGVNRGADVRGLRKLILEDPMTPPCDLGI
jgi:NADPH-dependent 2,4-dienoyl-CoA reductase/sulfur reductase-like enzyme